MKAVNPAGEAPYSGPTGGVEGTISVKGDPPPVQKALLAKIPDKCPGGREAYGKLFREGMLRSLADVLVTAIGYKGFVPARDPAVRVEARSCAWNTRTIALTFGQRIEVLNKETSREAYVPNLLGGSMPAQMVAVPGGEPVRLYPMKVGRFGLTDSMRLFMFADVFVVKYPTFDVTGLDGKYRIKGIPVGEVTVTAFLPAIMQTVEKTVTIESGKTLKVDFEIPFDKHKNTPKPGPLEAPTAKPNQPPIPPK